MKPLLIFHHQGFGDHLICNGLVRTLAKERRVIVLCWPEYFESVRFMYSDAPHIGVLVCPKSEGEAYQHDLCRDFENDDYEIMKLGYLGGDSAFDHLNCAVDFYRQAGVPFEQMRDGFHAPDANPSIFTPAFPFAVVHEYQNPDRNFTINLLRIKMSAVVVDNQTRPSNLFEVVPTLRKAAEIHCISSWMLVLIELNIASISAKLFLHKYARPGWVAPFPLKGNWTIVE